MRTRIVWIVAVLLAVLTVTAFSVVSARRLGTQKPPTGALADALADRVVALMQTEFRDVTSPDDAPVRCVARPFGVRPEGLTRAAEATTIYAWVYCRSANRSVLTPVALRLGRPPSVRVPEAGDGRRRSILRIFPADVRSALRRVDGRSLRSSLDDGSGTRR